jgi:predicted membrane protein
MLAQGPRLLLRAVKERRPGLLVLALDNLVPPFSLLILGWLTGFAITATAGLLGAALGPATLLAACGLWSGVLFIVLTQRFGRVELRKALAEVPRYMLSRVPLLAAFVFGRQRNWIPTARDPQPSAGAATDEETSGKPR